VEPQEPAAIDGRELRLGQGVVTVLLLGGFVFRLPPLVVAAAVVSAPGALLGPSANPIHAMFRATIAPRARAPRAWEAPASIRALDTMAALLCGLASLAFLIGAGPLGWLLALVEAAVAVTAAATGVNAAVMLRERLRRRA
jgi:hypothetical protein